MKPTELPHPPRFYANGILIAWLATITFALGWQLTPWGWPTWLAKVACLLGGLALVVVGGKHLVDLWYAAYLKGYRNGLIDLDKLARQHAERRAKGPRN